MNIELLETEDNQDIPSASSISESEILKNQKIMLENQQQILLDLEKILKLSISNKKGKPSDKGTQDQQPKNLRFIRLAKSMEEIKSNSLVSGLFSQVTIEDKIKLVCDACTNYNRKYINKPTSIGIAIEDPDYIQGEDNQPRLFINFKSVVCAHVSTMNHSLAVQEFIRESNV